MKYLPYLALAVILPIVFVGYVVALGYTPLCEELITLPNETEILLFSVQAGLGAAVIGYFFGSKKGKKSRKTSPSKGVTYKPKFDLKYLVLLAIVIVIFIVPFAIHPNAEFSGTDGQGPAAIEEGGYTPWIDPLGFQPGELGEKVIFSLQVAIGAIILAYLVGYIKAKGN
ncbi:MAG: energy-coupling factor ABC transporter substrate-binding protein [Nitrososphaerota archaeon]|jgi:cobalt transport protein|uniref:energy-coupling factor ABC transporter substrate-binding protein n=1 Tax=Candidatus Bathycorpusculum sp. TaxID=2994959 RepID=UPI00281C67D5|nr:energy-coupling factor ABC transporter substrate-binding protein [Candidatus Termiticorpusculum sp.]MCL2257200.1 energy-coupling factor ABC transporter substrate-binding protein [Candidatus Termiticorpusculum sp.]MCL2292671.1 energy-coupling factor ABC transporter substrate-binding protein [Candidatus Termiticorpusculum sp.]MDR0460916.1 energy-coupling factor ABC transporter substrate-binding protein [Nitrososphaerota archaeon]